MVAAVRGLETAAQCENVSMPCWMGGQIADSTTPASPAASAVTIGTERLPEKNARYAGRVVR